MERLSPCLGIYVHTAACLGSAPPVLGVSSSPLVALSPTHSNPVTPRCIPLLLPCSFLKALTFELLDTVLH